MLRELIIGLAAILIAVGCGSERVERSSQATTAAAPTLEECVGVFAASVHAHCTDTGPAPSGPGTVPSEDGIVRGEGGDDDHFGLEKAVSSAPADPKPATAVDVHCAGDALPAAIAAKGAAFRACVGARSDASAACSSALDAPCPPGLNDEECTATRAAAASLCAADATSA